MDATYNNTQESGQLDAADFIGNYLKKEDLSGETPARIVEVRNEVVQGERKLVAQFAEFQKPLILNKTNIRFLWSFFNSRYPDDWKGDVTLYVDDSVYYAGSRTGGTRIKGAAARNGAGNGYESAGAPHLGTRNN